MSIIVYLIPVALALGGLGLAAFLWAATSGQFDDPEGAAHRILIDEDKPMGEPASADDAFRNSAE
ncbi:cbb3-type cytochrome oxidase assembly protein CcoS [Hyphomonas johnsonii]|uniref:Cbb3-type cytochrome oxidase maturation protein n=1 Tax=Hyphomonas johnsonii MHS-2 TaxID=1280950 RepID=A0A059FRV8_9PROT|nr:cbb3-type cytochrome oxidase assembly protein CcoS [Hyphomonas johnsonii]KCZ93405.1 cbb3-type cytochrome oxidase maturation protein [Hyphomonas johnsonii MHS-2]